MLSIIELELKPISSNAPPVIVSCAVELVTTTKPKLLIVAVTGTPLEFISSIIFCASSTTGLCVSVISTFSLPTIAGVLIVTTWPTTVKSVVATLSTVTDATLQVVGESICCVIVKSVCAAVAENASISSAGVTGTPKVTGTPLILICFVSVIVGFATEPKTCISLTVTV